MGIMKNGILPSNLVCHTWENRMPGQNDDATQSIMSGSIWYNITADQVFICIDNTAGNAQWRRILTAPLGA